MKSIIIKMKTLYIKEHLACSNYVSDHYTGFTRHYLNANEDFQIEQHNLHYLLFVLDGTVEIRSNEFDYRIYKSDTMVAFSKNSQLSGKAITNSKVYLLCFDKHINVCDKLVLESLYTQFPIEKNEYLGLPIKEGMKRVLDSMDFYLDNRLQCMHLHTMKLQEIFFVFRGFYKKEDMINFFSPILNKTVNFKDFVIANYQKVKTVEELSTLYGCSLRSFNRKFKEHFDDSPYNWILTQRAKHVKAQLLTPGIDFSEIIKEFKFSSASHFSTYCKKQFGVTPRDIRKTVQ